MIRQYEIWHHIPGSGYTKWATRDNREQAIKEADTNAGKEPSRLWEVYEVTRERIHNVAIEPKKRDQ